MAQASAPATGTSTVTVYNRHPSGLVLRVGKMSERTEGMTMGSRIVNEWQQTDSFTVAGPARKIGEDASAPVIAGYAVTHGVPKDLWDQWLKDNKDTAMVRNRVIFAHEKQDHGDGLAKELRDTRTGLEPLAQGSDPRAPGSDRVVKLNAAA